MPSFFLLSLHIILFHSETSSVTFDADFLTLTNEEEICFNYTIVMSNKVVEIKTSIFPVRGPRIPEGFKPIERFQDESSSKQTLR